MPNFDKTYSDLTVWASRDESQGAWLFGVTMDGADVVIYTRKLGGVDSDLESARLAALLTPAAPAEPASPPAPSE